MCNEKEVSPKIVLNIGPASIAREEPYIRVNIDKFGDVQSPEEVIELAESINHPLTTQEAREFMGCATCKSAAYVQSAPNNELRIQATVSDLTNLQVQAGCQVLVYSASHGFPQDSSCLQAKKPIHFVVSATNQKFSFWRTLFSIIKNPRKYT